MYRFERSCEEAGSTKEKDIRHYECIGGYFHLFNSEGIGLIQKVVKNMIQWIEIDPKEFDESDELKGLREDLKKEEAEERELDELNEGLRKELQLMSQEASYAENAYLEFEDIKALETPKSQEDMQFQAPAYTIFPYSESDSKFIVVRAPQGTTLEMPEPAEIMKLNTQILKSGQNLHGTVLKNYQYFLCSEQKEIYVYMLEEEEDTFKREEALLKRYNGKLDEEEEDLDGKLKELRQENIFYTEDQEAECLSMMFGQ